MRRIILALASLPALTGAVWADGLTPVGDGSSGRCYLSGSSGPTTPCVLRGSTWVLTLGGGRLGPLDSGTVGGTAITAILNSLAPRANPTFTGTVTAPALRLNGADGSTALALSAGSGGLSWTSAGANSFLWNSNSTLYFGTNTANDLVFGTNNLEKARIKSTGEAIFNSSGSFGGPVSAPSYAGDASATTITPSATAAPGSAARRLADASIPVIPGLSTSQATFSCTTVANGSGLVTCPGGHDFAVGHGIRINGIGNSFGSYSIPSLAAPTNAGMTPTAGSTTRVYALVPTDGLQGYGARSATTTITNSPASLDVYKAVQVNWTEGGAAPPAYIVCGGPSAGAMQVLDYVNSAGNGGTGSWVDYARPLPKQQDWLPAGQVCPSDGPVRSGLHQVITSVSGNSMDVGTGIGVAAGTAVTIRHDNALPIRNATNSASTVWRIPVGTYLSSITSFSGSNISINSSCLYGSGRTATRLLFNTAMIGVGAITASGTAPCLYGMTLDNGSDWSTQQALFGVFPGTVRARLGDVSIPDMSKFGLSDSGTDTLFDNFDVTKKTPVGWIGTSIVSPNCKGSVYQNFIADGASLDLSCVAAKVRNCKIINWRSGSGVVTEQAPGSDDVEISNCELASYAPAGYTDKDYTIPTGIEIWSPRTRVSNLYIHDNPGGGISAGGPYSIYENIIMRNNAGVAFNCRNDSAIYNCHYTQLDGIQVVNDDKTNYTTTYGYYTQAGNANGGTYTKFGPKINLVGTTAKIDSGTLTGTETFTAMTTTPPQ